MKKFSKNMIITSSKLKLLIAGGLLLSLIAGFLMLFTVIMGVFLFNSATDADKSATRQHFWAAAPAVSRAIASVEPTALPVETNTDTEPATSQPTNSLKVATPTTTPSAPSEETVAPTATNTSVQSARPAPATPTPQATAPNSLAQKTVLTITTTATPTKTPSPTITASPTTHATATTQPTNTPPSTNTPSPTATTSSTATPSPGRISGRLLVNSDPADQGLTLRLEDSQANRIAETDVAGGGTYTFDKVPPSVDGYTVVFIQEDNTQVDTDEVISWGWLGPVPVANNAVVKLPDFDIALQGFGQTNPAPNASFSAAALSSAPITFKWNSYPQAEAYWVDLANETTEQVIWQDAVEGNTSLTFNGTTDSGPISPGEYWWGVGARRSLGDYTLVVYGYLPVLQIE